MSDATGADALRRRPGGQPAEAGSHEPTRTGARQDQPRVAAPQQRMSNGKLIFLLMLSPLLLLPLKLVVVDLLMTSPERRATQAFSLPDPPPLEVNTLLARAERLYEGRLHGPEQIVHRNGYIYSGTADGRVVRASEGGEVTTIARIGKPPCGGYHNEPTCGRPMGMKFDASGFLIVCDAYPGLYRINVESGEVHLLLPASIPINGRSLHFLNGLDIAKDGTIYFTDSSEFGVRDFGLDMLSGRATGRLIRYDPGKNESIVLLEAISYANGVQLSPNEDFLLVVESFRARILKYHLKDSKAGQWEIFADNLPCFPDNIRPSAGGGYWTSSGFTRYAGKAFNGIDFLAPCPFLRHVLSWLPYGFLFSLDPEGSILIELSAEGKILRTLMDKEGATVRLTADVEDQGGVLYLGSFAAPYIARIDTRTKQ